MAMPAPSPTTLLESLLPPELYAAVRRPEPPGGGLEAARRHLAGRLADLEPFVPPRIARAVRSADPGPLPAAYVSGTLLCADLSGFTALTAQLSSAGRQGSEEVSAIINQIFARLLQAVAADGGEVIKFAGDAITAFFDAARLGPAQASHAVAAALAMQQAMHAFNAMPTSAGVFRLRLRVTVHSGMVFLGEVGDGRRRELIVTGRAVNQVIAAQRYAAAGEIVITPPTRALLPAADTRDRFPDLYLLLGLPERPPRLPAAPTWPEPAPDLAGLLGLAAAIQALGAYVPEGLLQRLGGPAHSAGEFRPVSVVFTQIAALGNAMALLDDSAGESREIATVHEVLNTCYGRLQAALGHFGGSINKVDMAVGGDRLMGTFGAPIAHEDDPARAVKAALELRAALREIDRDTTTLLRSWREIHGLAPARPARPAEPPVGLASGIVFAGIVGTPERHEYTVMGKIVNLAARLFEAAAPGDLILPAPTYHAVRDLVEAEALHPLRLKGFASPIDVFQVQRLRAAPGHAAQTPFVGRAAELERIIARLAPGNQSGCIIALAGAAGMGKTRLAEEALRRISPATIIRVLCQGYEQTIPYAAAGRIARDLLQIAPALPRSAQIIAAEQRLGQLLPVWSRFLPLLGPILGLPITETSLTRALGPAQRRERTDDILALLILEAARRQPLALLVDGLDQIDASSAAILERVAASLDATPLALLLTYRPRPGLSTPWCDLPHCLTLEVAPLSPAESAELLTNLLGGPPPDELAPALDRAAGTPLFVEQTAQYLLRTRAITRSESGRLTVANPAAVRNIPGQIEQLLVAQLDQLGEETRSLVQLAAVIGHEFAETTLAAVAPAGGARHERLRELVDLGILESDPRRDRASFRFRQALVRDVAYTSLLYARRQSLHAATAQALEGLYAGQLDDLRVVLAHHYQHAAQPLPAFANTMAAAEQAQERYANQEALALYDQALALAGQLDRLGQLAPDAALRLYGRCGDALAATGAFDQARSRYAQALAGLGQGALDRQASLRRKIGSTHEQQGDWAGALDWFVAAAENIGAAAPDHRVMVEYAQILSAIGWVHFRQGDLEQAGLNLEQALDLIRPLGVDNEEAGILNRLGGVAYVRGDMEQSRAYVEQSLAASERGGDLIAQATALGNLGNLTASQGLGEESIRFYEQALALHEQTGSRRMLAITANNLSLSLRDVERYADALRAVEQSHALAVEQRDRYTQMVTLGNSGRIQALLGDADTARRHLLASQSMAEELGLVSDQIENYVSLAELALQQGDLAAALAELDRGRAIAADTSGEEYGRLRRLEAQVRWAQGDRAAALDLLRDNVAFFRERQNIPEARRSEKLIGALGGQPLRTRAT